MLEKELKNLGLSDKEVKVYLAAIQLGPSSVQRVSLRSKVNRATTYVVVDNLMEMGLMSTYEEGKKTYYVAERPEKLQRFFESEKEAVEEKIVSVSSIMPELQSLYNDRTDKPRVKYYDGPEGLKSIYEDFFATLKKGGEICTFLPLDNYKRIDSSNQIEKLRKERKGKGIAMHVIYTSVDGRDKSYEERSTELGDRYLFIDYDKFPIKGGANVYEDKIFMFDYKGKKGGILIENDGLADFMRSVFKLIWNKYQ